MKLVIVESPTKARKLAEYLGGGYKVEASVGHVRDLPDKKLGIDLEHDFEPTYEVDPEKQDIVTKLTRLAQTADHIYLATDPDREGEAIAWHLKFLLMSKGDKKVSEKKFARATFHEITKSAVLTAMEQPQELNLSLVDAQQARRVVDRLVGYQVSPVLWKKVRRGLSAGRVQSVALRLIVEREREIEAFVAEEYWEIDVAVATQADSQLTAAVLFPEGKQAKKIPQDVLIVRLVSINGKAFQPHTSADVEPITADLPKATYEVAQLDRKSRERSSLPPFTTSTLQQAAANKLGMTSKQTMTLAQQLYEEGLITYHRTDSVALSSQAIAMAREYVGETFGDRYIPEKPRYFSTKSKNAQEAHEAIRVTDARLSPDVVASRGAKLTERHAKLYDLIRRRFLASQMSAAQYDQTTITLHGKGQQQYELRTTGSVITFDGWLKLFEAQEDVILPQVEVGQVLPYQALNAAQKFTQPPARYNDASLVKELEKRGIGRPSTYASIISVIVDRGYVERIDKRFGATATGMTVNDFLVEHFKTFMDYDFTAEMEENLDRISRGEKPWKEVVREFYAPLEKIITEVTKEAPRVQIPVEETGEKCPTCGATDGGMIVIRTGRFGKFKSCNRFPDCKFTENIVETLPNQVCPLCAEGQVVVKKSRWGKGFFGCSRYPECTWASWQKPAPDLRISAKEWEMMQAQRAERQAAKKAAQEKAGATKAIAKSSPKKAKSAKTTTKKTATKKSTTKAKVTAKAT